MKRLLSLLLSLLLITGIAFTHTATEKVTAADKATIKIVFSYNIDTPAYTLKDGDTLTMYAGQSLFMKNVNTDGDLIVIPDAVEGDRGGMQNEIISYGYSSFGTIFTALKEGTTTFSASKYNGDGYDNAITLKVKVVAKAYVDDITSKLSQKNISPYIKIGSDGNVYYFEGIKIKNDNTETIKAKYQSWTGFYEFLDGKYIKVASGKSKTITAKSKPMSVEEVSSLFSLTKKQIKKLKAGKKIKIDLADSTPFITLKYGDLYFAAGYSD